MHDFLVRQSLFDVLDEIWPKPQENASSCVVFFFLPSSSSRSYSLLLLSTILWPMIIYRGVGLSIIITHKTKESNTEKKFHFSFFFFLLSFSLYSFLSYLIYDYYFECFSTASGRSWNEGGGGEWTLDLCVTDSEETKKKWTAVSLLKCHHHHHHRKSNGQRDSASAIHSTGEGSETSTNNKERFCCHLDKGGVATIDTSRLCAA